MLKKEEVEKNEELVGISIDEQIGQALKKMPVSEVTIRALGEEYLPLKTNGIDDKESYQAVYAAHATMVKIRTSVESARKSLKADALKFGRAVDAEAERLTDLSVPIEEHLYKQRMLVDDEKARVKAEKDREEQERLQGRVAKLLGYGMTFDGNIYKRGEIIIIPTILKAMDDEKFTIELARVEADYKAELAQKEEAARLKEEEEARLAAEKIEADRIEAGRKAEEDRLRKIKDDELAVERERLDKIAKEQIEKESAIKAAQDKLDAEKEAIEDQKRKEAEEKRHQEEIAKAKAEAAEQARKDEQARVEREAKEKEERERLAAIEAEEKKAQMSDKEKLKELLANIEAINIPAFKSKKAGEVSRKVGQCFIEACNYIREGM